MVGLGLGVVVESIRIVTREYLAGRVFGRTDTMAILAAENEKLVKANSIFGHIRK